jgi:hypothetical protein
VDSNDRYGAGRSGSRLTPKGLKAALTQRPNPNQEADSGNPKPPPKPHALLAATPHLASAASSLTRASTHLAPSGVCSFFQNGAWVFR